MNLKELLIKMVRRILFYGFGYSIDYIFKEILIKKHLACSVFVCVEPSGRRITNHSRDECPSALDMDVATSVLGISRSSSDQCL